MHIKTAKSLVEGTASALAFHYFGFTPLNWSFLLYFTVQLVKASKELEAEK
ncbi:MAG TPA: hypothetical protein VN036_06715 [Devosia sp.]|nr:hypothetical protein [Devosia sp.]